MTPIVSASILSADWGKLREEIRQLEEAKVDWIHVDVMDGRFVPNLTFGPKFVSTLRQLTSLPLDLHLMIEEPESYIEAFTQAGADMITVHTESTKHLQRLISSIKDKDLKVGVAINPATSLEELRWILNDIDLVLMMSVNPGFGGQKFIPATVEKIQRFKDQFSFSGQISVDGGLNQATSADVWDCGADVFVVGSYLFETQGTYKEKVDFLKNKKR